MSCATKQSDAEQGYYFAGNGYGAGRSADARFGATVHSVQRIEPESLSIRLLREQKLLRDIFEKHSSSLSAAREVCFGSTGHRNFAFCGCVHRTVSSRENLVGFLEPRLHGAFAAAARAHLHSSHLIRRV